MICTFTRISGAVLWLRNPPAGTASEHLLLIILKYAAWMNPAESMVPWAVVLPGVTPRQDAELKKWLILSGLNKQALKNGWDIIFHPFVSVCMNLFGSL